MLANFPTTRVQRRGVVLILVLGMLSLLAAVGVTFATFSGQARVNARNFSQASNWPDSAEMMDYALAQLIDDTDNPMSAIRGHSLKRDMYGNDAVFNSYLSGHPNTGAAFGISQIPTLITASTTITVQEINGLPKTVNVQGLYRCVTNIPGNLNASGADPSLYSYNFTRWILRFAGQLSATTPPTYNVAETHEILVDDPNDSSGYRTFYVAPWDGSYGTPSGLPASITDQPTLLEMPAGRTSAYSLAPTIPYPLPTLFAAPQTGTPISSSEQVPVPYYVSVQGAKQSILIGMQVGMPFTLDGRYLHAFNGPGMSALDSFLPASTWSQFANRGMAQYANFRFNGNIVNNGINQVPPVATPSYGFPNNAVTVMPVSGNTFFTPGMDEDYDACDLENWFLAMQSADGQVIIPSFHRPGILVHQKNASGAVTYDDWTSTDVFAMSKILRPRATDGHSPTAFPNLYPDNNGRITYDVDNDGDGTTDSVWLDLGYPAKRNAQGQLFKPLYAFMVIGLNGRIPLNTAGNLQLRDLNNVALAMHASGKGFSPSEIDPTYALQNGFIANSTLYTPSDNAGYTQAGTYSGGVYTAGDLSGTPVMPWGSSGVPVSVTQLRNILAGMRSQGTGSNAAGQSNNDVNFVMVNGQPVFFPNGVGDAADIASSGVVATTTPPVAGRWGEGDKQPIQLVQTTTPVTVPPLNVYTYLNPVRAGISGPIFLGMGPNGTPLGYDDARDDNYNTFDFYPSNTSGASAPTTSNYGGAAVVITTLGENADFYDASGSLTLPVERMRRFVTPIDVAGDGYVNNFKTPVQQLASDTQTYMLGSDDYGRVAFYKHFRPPGLPVNTPPGLVMPFPTPTIPPGTPTSPIWYPYATTNWLSNFGNPAPLETPASIPADKTSNLYHGLESYRNVVLQSGYPNPVVPTQPLLAAMPSNYVATAPASTPTYDQFINTILGLANLNEADEMQLYQPGQFDQAFGPSDLEWLYRQQDTDGDSLSSRLQYLAQISFTNPLDGIRRRRLFSLDSWETTNFVWANDLPLNDPQFFTTAATNSRFPATLSANLSNMTAANVTPLATPSIAHRDRKINLNFPLPVSNRYDEPVRQKWIRETYQLLKMILPPKAVDTPEELAQLSQFVVNIIDFRDPDCTATRFVNTDVAYSSPAAYDPTTKTGTPAVINFAANVTYTPSGNLTGVTTLPPAYSPLYDNANSPFLVQYGMENPPVAINEVLAFQYQYNASGTHTPIVRMFVELVNMLTTPASSGTACDLGLNGWDLVVMPDDPTGRPDPFTGQLPYNPAGVSAGSIKGITLSGKALPYPGAPSPPWDGKTDPGSISPRLKPLDADGKTHPYVIRPLDPPAGAESGAPTFAAPVDDTRIDLIGATILGDTTLTTFPQNKYYWVYLRRPANPFDTTYDPARPNENRVVVDCFRFMLNASQPNTFTNSPDTATPAPTAAGGDIYSMRRLQPFRGGHAVPPIPTAALSPSTPVPPANYCMTPYGYSEQTTPATGTSSSSSLWKGTYGMADATGPIWHSLGTIQTGRTNSDDWDYLQFNDRDFTSVSELLMVPGCPPGLFTKQFVEDPPPIKGSTTYLNPPVPPAARPAAPSVFGEPETEGPQTYPYLVDEFFYTAQAEPTTFMADAGDIPPTISGTVGGMPNSIYWPDPGIGNTSSSPPRMNPAPIRPDANFPVNANYPFATFPLKAGGTPSGTAPNQYYVGPPTPLYIGGPSNAGWYKMFEFFDVPSPANGSYGPVAQGSNYDWARQDLKPGLLNINLIIDEEVFFALMSESWLKTLNYNGNLVPPYYQPGQLDLDNMGDTRLNVAQIPVGGATPQIVTQVGANGLPTAVYSMKNQGFMALDPYASGNNPGYVATSQVFDNRMKAAFSDFLKLRHGGSGFLFAHQSGNVGDPNLSSASGTTILASERPFRSFSYPDVNYTVMRPAALPPTASTTMAPYLPDFASWDNNTPSIAVWATAMPGGVAKSPYKTYVGDPGVKNPYLYTDASPVQPPPIPARRLFEVPDMWGNMNITITPLALGGPQPIIAMNPPGMPAFKVDGSGNPIAPTADGKEVKPSNASSAESTYPPAWWKANPPPNGWLTFTGDPDVNWQNLGPVSWTSGTATPVLANPDVSLAAVPTMIPQTATTPPPPPPPYVIVPNFYLGADTRALATPRQNDNRQHPAFRYDWLQKVANLTTVRTHQFAVWITVGFFEVLQEGDPSLGTGPQWHKSYDVLGQELNIQNGRNIRYRSFFIIDRTKAVGFSPQAPGNFRDCIVYRQQIE